VESEPVDARGESGAGRSDPAAAGSRAGPGSGTGCGAEGIAVIAKITRGSNPGNIGAYLHGPGHANEHFYERNGGRYAGGVVVGGNVFVTGDADEKAWVKEMRAAMRTRPEITKPIWQASLRNTVEDRRLTDAEWAQAGQTFAESMGFAEHPWVMVRHADDHVHVVVCRVSDEGTVWHGRNDRRAAQSA
ncbi:hypothetical protein PCS70012_02343, partial [Streptococcus pneumoniae PCS70012]